MFGKYKNIDIFYMNSLNEYDHKVRKYGAKIISVTDITE